MTVPAELQATQVLAAPETPATKTLPPKQVNGPFKSQVADPEQATQALAAVV